MLPDYPLRPPPILSQFAGDPGELIQAIGGDKGADFRPCLPREEGVGRAEVGEFFGVVGGVEEVAGAGGGLFGRRSVDVPPAGCGCCILSSEETGRGS